MDHQTSPYTRWSTVALVGSNMVPLVGVFFYGWDVFTLMLLFWFENVLIGVFNVLRMIACTPGSIVANASKFFFVPFFTVHYGGFCFGHGLFVFALFAPDAYANFGDSPVAYLELIPELFADPVTRYAILGLIASHGLSFVMNYLVGGEYRRTNISALMIRPYGRIVLLHIVLIFGGFLAMATGEKRFALVLLVVIKIGMDILAHRVEHKNRFRVEDEEPAAGMS